ncbi:MAG: efflux RND transporter permease subunit, partial [Gammaproteobacteria bacterium]
FTATSMIGWIALAGIIVRNSILLVDFTKQEVASGVEVRDAVINSCRARTRPIVITALALVGGSSVIITDPIFEGMAISLLFGVLVSTVLTLFVIPLGCISAKKAFPGQRLLDEDGSPIVDEKAEVVAVEEEYKTPLWMRIYSVVFGVFEWIVVVFQMIFNLGRMLFGMVFSRSEPEQSTADIAVTTTSSAAAAQPEPAPAQTSAPTPSPVKKSEPKAKPEPPAGNSPVSKAKRVAKKVARKKAPVKKSEPIKAPVKKAPSKKSSPGGRRGIRLKDDENNNGE